MCQPPSSRVADVRSEPASEPASASVSANAPISSPRASGGTKRARCSSVPKREERQRHGARVHGDGDADPRVAARELLDHEHVGEEVGAGAAVLLRDADAHQAELGELRRRRRAGSGARGPTRPRAARSRRATKSRVSAWISFCSGESSKSISRKRRNRGPTCGRDGRPATCSRRSGHGAYFGSPSPSCEHLHDRHARVEADQVGERERAHRVREAELRDRVDRLRLGDAVVQRPDRLVDERHQDPVRDEAGEVVRDRRRLAEILGERDDRGRRLVGGLAPAHDLDELQHRHRVEEVHADHAVGPVGDRRRAR